MKKLSFLTGLLALVCLSFTFTACGSDDEEQKPENEETGTPSVNAGIQETSNQLILTYSLTAGGITIVEKWTCDFANDECIRSIMETTYPNEKIAQQEYNEIIEEQDKDDTNIYSIAGKVVKIDNTATFKGYQKSVIKMVMEETLKEFNK